MKSQLTVAMMLLSMSGSLAAKGLNELTPHVEETPSAVEEAQASPPPSTAPAPASTAPSASPTDLVEEKKPEEPKSVEKPVEVSAMSKRLADRLTIFTGASLTRMKGPHGDWGGGGNADLSATYLLQKNPFPEGRLAKIDLYAMMSYSPQDVVVESQGRSYRGMMQILHAGLRATRPMTETFRYVTQATLGWATTNLHSLNSFPESTKLEAGGLQLGLGGGADWMFANKASVGPRLNISLGRFQTIGVGGEIGFVF